MISIAEHLAAPRLGAVTERRIDVLRRGDLETLHAASERDLVLRLDKHMEVAALQADVDDTKSFAPRRGERCIAHGLVHVAPPQAAHCRHDAHRHVKRMVRLELWP